MQYKGELAFSLYCITLFSLSTTSAGSWMTGVVHKELPLVPLPPGIVVEGPFPRVGLTVAASRILQMDKQFIIFMGTHDWFDSVCLGRWWIACLSKLYCLLGLRWELGWSPSVKAHVIEPWKSLLLGLQLLLKQLAIWSACSSSIASEGHGWFPRNSKKCMWESAYAVSLDDRPVLVVSPSHTVGSFKITTRESDLSS